MTGTATDLFLSFIFQNILGFFFPTIAASFTVAVFLGKFFKAWKPRGKTPPYWREEGGRKYIEVNLADGKTDRVYISKELIPSVYGGWIHKELATRKELIAMGFTGKIVSSKSGKEWEHVQAKTMDPLNKMADKYGGRFYIRAFTALDDMGLQLERQYQSLWGVDCYVYGTNTWISEYEKPEKTFLEKLLKPA